MEVFVCNGVCVSSSVELDLPHADPRAAIDVTVERGGVAAPALADGVEADFVVDGRSLVLSIRGVARYRVTGGTSVTVDAEPGASEEDVRLYLTGSVMGAVWLQRGLLPLHASAVEVPAGGCVALAGVTRAGKSSLAAHFVRAGHRLVADDVCVLCERDGGHAVWPGRPRVKLAVDALGALDEDPSELPRVGGTRDKYHLEVRGVTARTAAPVPLRGVFLLAYGDGRPRTVPLAGLDAVDAIGGHTYRQEFVAPLGLAKDWLRSVVAVAGAVPVMRLIRPRGHEWMDGAIAAILGAVEGGQGVRADP